MYVWFKYYFCLTCYTIFNALTNHIHVIPPWSSWRLQEMSHKILLKYITFYQNFEISREWMKNILTYSIHFSKPPGNERKTSLMPLWNLSHVCNHILSTLTFVNGNSVLNVFSFLRIKGILMIFIVYYNFRYCICRVDNSTAPTPTPTPSNTYTHTLHPTTSFFPFNFLFAAGAL